MFIGPREKVPDCKHHSAGMSRQPGPSIRDEIAGIPRSVKSLF